MLSDGDNTYKYDSANRVSEVITKTGSIQKNRYDAEGLRAELEENGRLVSSDSEAAIAKSCVYGFCNLRIITMHLMKWVVN